MSLKRAVSTEKKEKYYIAVPDLNDQQRFRNLQVVYMIIHGALQFFWNEVLLRVDLKSLGSETGWLKGCH